MFSRRERSSPGADWDNETGRPEETDGENPEGSIGQDGSKCVKQDGTCLSPTSSTPKVRSSTASRRTPFRRHHEPGEPATAGARRAELVRILGIVVLAALMGLTSWVVASISTWLVPVYVTAMVLIFVIPRVPHPGEPGPAGEPAGVSADRASGAISPASSGADSPGATTLEVDGSPEASATGAKPPGSPTPKRRRTRGQGRKPVKPGPEPAVTASPVAWNRIGPGKFVRADSRDQGDASAPVSHAPLEAAEASIEAKSSPPDLVDHAPLEAAEASIEASIEAKSSPPDLVDHAPLEAAEASIEASIEAKSSPPDLVEETNPNAVSTAVDVPNRADLNESGPSPEHETPSEEPAAIADPEPGSSVVALVLEADVGRQESDSTAAPATIAIDEDSSADSIDVGRQESDSTAAPATIAIDKDSSADSIDVGRQESDSTAAPATIAIDEDSPADLIDVGRQESDSTAAPATIKIDEESPADLIVAEPVTEEYGIAPSAFGPGLLEATLEKEDHEQGWTDLPDSTGTGTKTPVDAGNGNGNRCKWMRLKLQSGVQTVSGCLPRLEMSRRLQNVRSGARRQGFAEPGRAANCSARAKVRRNFGRSSRAHRGYQPRSPPARS